MLKEFQNGYAKQAIIWKSKYITVLLYMYKMSIKKYIYVFNLQTNEIEI